MSYSVNIRCDQCGRTEDDEAARSGGWQRIMPRVPVSAYFTGEHAPQADLCSWACVRDYAMMQILDPSPDRP